jgi:glycosyltransferase involved in cell wall biosynthesis
MHQKALVVLHVISGLNDGGAEGALFRLCTNDSVNRHVVISMLDEGKYGSLLSNQGVEVLSLNMQRGRITLNGLLRLWRLISSHKPDVVQTWMYHADFVGGILAKLAGVKTIYWGVRHSNLSPGTVKRSTIWIARICAALSDYIPTKIVFCSSRSADLHKKMGYSGDKIVVIPNGYPLDQLVPDVTLRSDLRKKWGVAENVPVMGMVARFDAQKDHATLFKALSTIKHEFNFILVGSGMDEQNKDLMVLLDQAKIKASVLLLGQRNDIPAIMNALDIHVLSSLGEAFPNVLCEAMACGTPCITTDVGDAALIVGDTGWIVPACEPQALADAINSALQNKDDFYSWSKRQELVRKRIFENFSIEKMVNSYQITWLETLI